MEIEKSAKVIPINFGSQKMAGADQEDLAQSKVLSEQERLRRLIDDYVAYLKRDHGYGSLGALSPASIRHQQVVLAGFYLWIQGNLREEGE